MATSTASGAVYGVGVYGVAEYGVASVTVIPDGVQASATTDSGLVIEADALHVVVGATVSGSIGLVAENEVFAAAVVTPTGVAATAELGTISQRTVNRVEVTGVEGTGTIGSPVLSGVSNFAITAGTEGVTSVGDVNAQAKSVTAVTGVSCSGSVGTVVVLENEVQVPTGVSATGSVGTVSISTTHFDYGAVAAQYSAARTVLVARRTTARDRTVIVAA